MKTEREQREDLATEVSRGTRKKVKFIGTEQYVNTQTGEIQEMHVISIEQRDFNFHKIWISHILEVLDLVGNSKSKFIFWLFDHLNSDNQIIMNITQMVEKSQFSRSTIQRTIKILVENDVLIKVNQGAYRVNPSVIFKGTIDKRMNVLLQYENERVENTKKRHTD